MNVIRSSARVPAGSLFLGLALFGVQPALAQDYPAKTVRVVTAEVGSGSEVVARIVAQALSTHYGQPFVIDGRTGGVIAGEVVSKSPPDGYTLLFYGNTLWTTPLLRKQVPYNIARDFAPITMAVQSTLVLVVHPSLQVNSTRDLIALAKAKPGQLDYSVAAVGSGNFMAAELFLYLSGVKMTRIGHKGFPSALLSTVTGQAPIFFPTIGAGMAQVQAGKLKGIAVTSAKPSALAPGLPTIAETLPGYESVFSSAAFAPTGTSAALITRLNRDIIQMLQRDDVKQKLLAIGMEPVGSSPQEVDAAIKAEMAIMGKVIAKAGIQE